MKLTSMSISTSNGKSGYTGSLIRDFAFDAIDETGNTKWMVRLEPTITSLLALTLRHCLNGTSVGELETKPRLRCGCMRSIPATGEPIRTLWERSTNSAAARKRGWRISAYAFANRWKSWWRLVSSPYSNHWRCSVRSESTLSVQTVLIMMIGSCWP